MFDIVRNNQKLVQIVLAVLLLPFAFFGVDSYFRSGGAGAGDVAAVGKGKISLAEFQQALREQQDRLRPTLGGRDPAMLNSPELRNAVLDNLIQRQLLIQYANEARLVVSNEQLGRFISAVPSLQVDGKFSPERYEAVVAAQGMSKPMFEARLRQDLAMQQATAAVAEAALAGNAAGGRWLAAQLEEREVSEAIIRSDRYLAQVKVAPEAIKAYYDANQARFQVPEQLRAEYLVLSRDQLAEQVAVSDDEIKAWYQSHADRYRQPEERRASHILLTAAKDASPEAVKAAETKAAELLAQLRKTPADFDKLARQHSQDPGSAGRGGDLDWFGRGAMVKPFEDAVFGLKEGQISEPVRSDFGFHIIMLTGVRAERARPLEEVKGEITAELKTQGAAKKYLEMAEAFTNTVYEQSDSLEPAAQKFKLTVQKSDWIVKGGAATGPLANPKLNGALFGDDALKNKRNTDAIEVSPNTLVSARVFEHKPAAQQTLETVTGTVEKFLANQEAAKLAAREGEARLAQLKKGEGTDVSWGAPRKMTRAQAASLPPEVVRAVFGADAGRLPAYAGIAGPGGYGLVRVSAVKPFVAAADGAGGAEQSPAKALKAQYARVLADEEMIGWMAALKRKYPVEINKAALESKER